MVRKLCCSPEFQAALLFSATLTPAIPAKKSHQAIATAFELSTFKPDARRQEVGVKHSLLLLVSFLLGLLFHSRYDPLKHE
jgi:hypothetical protein